MFHLRLHWHYLQYFYILQSERKSKQCHINEETENYFLAREIDHLKQIQLLQN